MGSGNIHYKTLDKGETWVRFRTGEALPRQGSGARLVFHAKSPERILFNGRVCANGGSSSCSENVCLAQVSDFISKLRDPTPANRFTTPTITLTQWSSCYQTPKTVFGLSMRQVNKSLHPGSIARNKRMGKTTASSLLTRILQTPIWTSASSTSADLLLD